MANTEDMERVDKFLVNFAEEKRYCLEQLNGQRIFGPPVDEPSINLDYRYEVYIWNLPKDCYEDELLP
ncbi:RNA recognition motif [Popillia japonica]